MLTGAATIFQESNMSGPSITIPALQQKKTAGERITMLTCYDATFARLLDQAQVDALLVGDSLGMVVQGHENTLPVTLDEIIYHCRAVARGSSHAHIVADLPFMTYQTSPEQAVDNAGRLLKDGGAHAVKMEGGESIREQIRRCTAAGIPVMGHLGLTPQSVHKMGGYKVQGKNRIQAEQILSEARMVEEAGAYSLVLEGVPEALGRLITEELSIPTIGIGAGRYTDGQVLVIYDLLGMDPDFQPRFVRRYKELGNQIVDAARAYCDDVKQGHFPNDREVFLKTG